MFSKVSARASQIHSLSGLTARSFKTTAAASIAKKPSIGDAVTILQSKVSGINQVVSINAKEADSSKPVFNTKKIAPSSFLFLMC